ncbi:tripartite tricarboxylate transporter substrate binding protein [Bradyrhizobium sp. LHD-71]|uniref:Bug family tripartite tricarboxylate transporter substrate binding protein n=1 Tax=Bradyrhizobium sp. LHD-71 TaxID=3072141 RepID=UPI00280DEC83|nr:tripartite tricarboxylate transporter substrate binding protein [Bradyrhizobium sp. LHD-71]MDQ8728267.1 tripartite tricarboxylate transporter substrate binding protein [Bradyrhizobium sp. LHD-71]
MSAARTLMFVAEVVAASCMLPTHGVTQEWPARPITLIVPYTAGGATDLYSRALADFMNRKYSYTVVVDNRPGAGGFLGVNAVQTSQPNGYTFGYFSSSTMIGYKFLGKDLVIGRDVEAVAQFQSTATISVVNPKVVPVKSLGELVAYLKTNLGTNYATIGVGSLNHMTMSAFARKAGLDVTHIPYKGGAPASAALIAGDVGIGIGMDPPSVLSHIEAGRLVPLASSGEQRLRRLPDLPTVYEAGFPDLGGTTFGGIIAPKNTPAEILSRFTRIIDEASKDPAFVERLQMGGSEVSFADAKTFQDALNSESERLGRIIVENNIKPE